MPDLLGLVVGIVDGDPQAVGIDAQQLGVELPRERDRVVLEVVAEAEVAEHLEEHEVARRAADVVEVVVLAARPCALLGGDGPLVGRRLVTREVRLEGHHAGHREEHGRVVRDQARRRDLRVAPVDEVVGEGPADLVG